MRRQPSTASLPLSPRLLRPRSARRLALDSVLGGVLACVLGLALPAAAQLGREVSMPRRLADGEEYALPLPELLAHGERLLAAVWTDQEGGGRPLTKGTGAPLADPSRPLLFPDNFNRISAPDANSCGGCHAQPHGFVGGGGDIVANVFVLGHRFDSASFDHDDTLPTRGCSDEVGRPVTLAEIANGRATLGMFGSGYIEMLARQMSADLRAQRDAIPPGGSALLVSKEIFFGELRRFADGRWDVSGVEGLPAPSLTSAGPADPPNLVLRPFHQAGAVVSLRQFTNNAFNHHHGIQTTERFGRGTDPDGDGHADEMSRAEVSAASLFQAAMPVPGRVIPRNPEIEQAVLRGESLFAEVGCASCHVPELPLDGAGQLFTEPNPFNPAGNLRPGEAPTLAMDLNDPGLPLPRLERVDGLTRVPAYTDLKLHDITSGPEDPNREALDMQAAPGSPEFFAGNSRFLTKKLWGAANEPPYFHHGKFTTMREAILAHAGEAEPVTDAFRALPGEDRDAVIEFLKTLQVLPAGTSARIVDGNFQARTWPPEAGGDPIIPRLPRDEKAEPWAPWRQ